MKIRNKDKTHKKYLYYPEEMKTNMEIKNVFLNMDKDGSGNNFNIFITIDNCLYNSNNFG